MESLVASFVKQIADQTVLTNTLIWIQLGVWIVFGVAIAIAGPYLKKRAELLATKADFNTLKQQLKDTTEVVEKVKTEISHADWASREWKTIRRLKIEALFEGLIALGTWQKNEVVAVLARNEPISDATPLYHVEMLIRLYLPQLNDSFNVLAEKTQKSRTWMLDSRQAISEVEGQQAKEEKVKELVGFWKTNIEPRVELVAVKTLAIELMKTLADT
ncbi:MAG: hypothetical protein JWM78_1317 [Verrucomicrobiaceae bacterium]|nr:hypothetical protein [Verrucomicrobiaceae bacterium]